MDKYEQLQLSKLELVKTCDLCGGRQFDTELVSNGWNLVKCDDSSCGLVLTSPRYTEAYLEKMYESRYYERNPAYLSTQVVEPSKDECSLAKSQMKKCVSKRMGGKPRFLDVGCGAGRIVAAFQNAGWDAVGIDKSLKAVSAGQNRGLDLRVTDLGNNRLGIFDMIAAFHVLEHVHSPKLFLQHCAGILVKGGLLLIEVPNYGSRRSRRMRQDWPYLYPDSHLYQFTEETLKRYLMDTGFNTIIECRKVGGRGPLESYSTTTCDEGRLSTTLRKNSQPRANFKSILFKLRLLIYWSSTVRQVVRYLLWDKFGYGEFIRVLARRT